MNIIKKQITSIWKQNESLYKLNHDWTNIKKKDCQHCICVSESIGCWTLVFTFLSLCVCCRLIFYFSSLKLLVCVLMFFLHCWVSFEAILAWCKAQVNVCYHYKSVSLFLLIIIPRTPTSHNKQLICHSMDFKTLLKAPCDIKYQGSSSRWSPSDACLPLYTF